MAARQYLMAGGVLIRNAAGLWQPVDASCRVDPLYDHDIDRLTSSGFAQATRRNLREDALFSRGATCSLLQRRGPSKEPTP